MNTPKKYKASDNSHLSYALAIAALREEGIRAGAFDPVNDMERRWAAEGNRPLSEFETVKSFQGEEQPLIKNAQCVYPLLHGINPEIYRRK